MMNIEGSNNGDCKASVHQCVDSSITGSDIRGVSLSRQGSLNRGEEKYIIRLSPFLIA
jgi:hypothetical protein